MVHGSKSGSFKSGICSRWQESNEKPLSLSCITKCLYFEQWIQPQSTCVKWRPYLQNNHWHSFIYTRILSYISSHAKRSRISLVAIWTSFCNIGIYSIICWTMFKHTFGVGLLDAGVCSFHLIIVKPSYGQRRGLMRVRSTNWAKWKCSFCTNRGAHLAYAYCFSHRWCY